MKSREILAQFRKGNMNEKTITEILVLLNERQDSLEKSLTMVGRMMNQLSDLMGTQLQALGGVQKFSQHLADRLGIKTTEVTSETLDDRIHMPGELK